MDHRLLEALVHGPERVVVSQMPLSEDPRSVTRFMEGLGQGDLVRVHHGASDVGVHDAGPVVVAAGHEAGPGGGADGGDVEPGQFHALRGQPVQVWGPQDIVPMASQLCPTLVVGDDEDDVGPAAFLGRRRRTAEEKTTQQEQESGPGPRPAGMAPDRRRECGINCS